MTALVDWASGRVQVHRMTITPEVEHAVAALEGRTEPPPGDLDFSPI